METEITIRIGDAAIWLWAAFFFGGLVKAIETHVIDRKGKAGRSDGH